ncbi:MAG: DUF4331 domain-containing protein [Chloroflexi bacterium]|nr:MAG: DUF4331 domain-containing protein [Chloroflexota bacterium]
MLVSLVRCWDSGRPEPESSDRTFALVVAPDERQKREGGSHACFTFHRNRRRFRRGCDDRGRCHRATRFSRRRPSRCAQPRKPRRRRHQRCLRLPGCHPRPHGHRRHNKSGRRNHRADRLRHERPAFRHVVLGAANGRTGFCDQPGPSGIDFFAAFNTNAIVIEVPNDSLSSGGGTIGVWATTLDRTTGAMIDQMGRPAINTVFNHTSADKEAFNVTPPSLQPTTGNFRSNVIGTLEALGGYSASAAGAIADILLPDVLTYTVGTKAAGPLNGRAPADDVIDVELGLVTQGAITTDCVGPHTYLSTFPYLGVAH